MGYIFVSKSKLFTNFFWSYWKLSNGDPLFKVWCIGSKELLRLLEINRRVHCQYENIESKWKINEKSWKHIRFGYTLYTRYLSLGVCILMCQYACSDPWPIMRESFYKIDWLTIGGHTVAIWTFTFHKISGFERVILKINFNPIYRQNLSIFLFENSDSYYSFFFYFLQKFTFKITLSKPDILWNVHVQIATVCPWDHVETLNL